MTHTARRSTVLAVGAMLSLAVSVSTAASAPQAARASRTFAGYEVSKPSHIRTVTTTFVVPTITCKKSLSGVGPSIVVRTAAKRGASTDDIAAVGVACVRKSPRYESIIAVNGHAYNDLRFAARDRVVATMTVRPSRTSVTLHDLTSGAHKTRTGAGRLGSVAYLGDEGLIVNSKHTGLDPFTRTSFTGSQVNGRSLAAQHAVPFERKRGSTVQISVGRLRTGGDFVLTFRHS